MTQFSSDFEPCSTLSRCRPIPRRPLAALGLAAGVVAAGIGVARAETQSAPRSAATSVATAAAPAAASTPELRQLWDAEQTWVRALTTGSPALLEQLVDSEFSFIGPDGQYEDREAYLAGYRALPSQGVTVSSVDLYDVKMRDLGQTAIVTGRVVARVKMGEQTIVENVRFTRVYARRSQGWRMVAGQGTRLAPPAP